MRGKVITEVLFRFPVTSQIGCQVCFTLVLSTIEELILTSNNITIATTQQYQQHNQDHTNQIIRIYHTTISQINNTILKMIILNYDKNEV